jgi:sodium/bile acid cotransporter 7
VSLPVSAWLVKRWFLLVLAVGATLALAHPPALAWAAWIDPRAIVAGALFLMAWTMPGRHLLDVLLRPWAALWAFALGAAAVPAAAWLLMPLLPAEVGLGLLISASVPCTLASALLWTRRGGGDEGTVLLVIVLSTATAWLTTTGWLALGTGAAVAVDSATMMLDLLLTLVLPFGVGQACRLVGPLARLAERRRPALGVAAQLLILCIMLKAAAKVGERLHADAGAALGLTVAVALAASVGLHTAALFVGLWTSRGLGFARPQGIAVAFACSQKTLPVALLLFERYFAAYPLAVLPLAFYHFGQLIVDTFVADALARAAVPVEAGKGEAAVASRGVV